MKLLEGKVAIVTGASRGIGTGIAKVFAEQGANVAFTYSSSEAPALALEKELNALGIKAKAYKSNAASFEEAEKLVADVLEDFGGIDILVNNAGITKDNLLMRMSENDFDSVKNYDRMNKTNSRKEGEIGFSVTRGGEIAGEHTVSFIGKNDRIDLQHKAFSRSIFVEGAIRASIFLSQSQPGKFTMKDVINSATT